MTSELINTIISAITGAFAGGIVTLLLDKRKERREDKKEKQNEKKKIYDDRPELQIIEYKDYLLVLPLVDDVSAPLPMP